MGQSPAAWLMEQYRSFARTRHVNPSGGTLISFRYDYCETCRTREAHGQAHWHDPYSCHFDRDFDKYYCSELRPSDKFSHP